VLLSTSEGVETIRLEDILEVETFPAKAEPGTGALADTILREQPAAERQVPWAQPENRSTEYRNAKRAEHDLRDLAKAEYWLREVIRLKRLDTPSAVKDLISLLGRRACHPEAIGLADAHRKDFSPDDQLKLDKLVLPHLVKAQRYGDAILVCERLIKASEPSAARAFSTELLGLLERDQRLERRAGPSTPRRVSTGAFNSGRPLAGRKRLERARREHTVRVRQLPSADMPRNGANRRSQKPWRLSP
jgi:hypothetical protein